MVREINLIRYIVYDIIRYEKTYDFNYRDSYGCNNI